MPVAAPPEGGAAPTSPAAKAGQSAPAAVDAFAALFADLQAADARAQSDAAADPNGVPAPAAPPTGDASRPPRKARSDDALLPVASNVIDLLAWVKANA